MKILLSQSLAILGAKLIGTFGAFKRHIRLLPKSFGVEINCDFPNQKVNNGEQKQRSTKEATNENHWAKHHKMVPVENSTRCAAFISKHQAERTPNKHAN